MRMIKIRYDDRAIAITERFHAALCEVMEAECEMMGSQGKYYNCWTWGRSTVLDLSTRGGIEFEFGGDDELPKDELGAFGVISGPLWRK